MNFDVWGLVGKQREAICLSFGEYEGDTLKDDDKSRLTMTIARSEMEKIAEADNNDGLSKYGYGVDIIFDKEDIAFLNHCLNYALRRDDVYKKDVRGGLDYMKRLKGST